MEVPGYTACETLYGVVNRLCLRAGLAWEQFDASDLAAVEQPVRGFVLTDNIPTRQALEMLASCYFFECTVSDKLYFRRRGQPAVATLTTDDMGAALDSDATDPFPITLGNELEIPAQFALTYMNERTDYQLDTQYTDRMNSPVVNAVSEARVPLVFYPDEAKYITEVSMADQFMGRVTADVAVLGQWAEVEPTDCVTAIRGGTSMRMRVVSRTDDYPKLAFTMVMEEASVTAREGDALAVDAGGWTVTDQTADTQQIIRPASTTVLVLLDIPIITDANDGAGFYMAANGTESPWGGAGVYVEVPAVDSVTYSQIATFNSSATLGTATTTLGDWTGNEVFDEASSVTVDIGENPSHALSSVARDTLLASGLTNLMVVGSELIQYRKATLISTGVYKLTGLLRGRRGTEWAMTGHAANETVVKIQSTGLVWYQTQLAELGVEHTLYGVTSGRSITTATGQNFTWSGVALMPFAPSDVRAARDGSGNIEFEIYRRSRLSTTGLSTVGQNIPLGEETEAYEIDILGDIGSPPESPSEQGVVRTISASSASGISYTAAQQDEDHLVAGGRVTVRAYQMSTSVGRGYPLEITI
jgi:hypothetical protein